MLAFALLHKCAGRQDVLLDDVLVRHLERQAKIAQEVADDGNCTLDERQARLGLGDGGQHLFRSLEHVAFVVDIEAVLLGLCLNISASVLHHVSQHLAHLWTECAAQAVVTQGLVEQSLNHIVWRPHGVSQDVCLALVEEALWRALCASSNCRLVVVAHFLRDGQVIHVLSHNHLGRIFPAALDCINDVLGLLFANGFAAGSAALIANVIHSFANSLIAGGALNGSSFARLNIRDLVLSHARGLGLPAQLINLIVKLARLHLRIKGQMVFVAQLVFDVLGSLLLIKSD